MTELVLYEKPVAIDRNTHKNLRLKLQTGDYGFAASTNSVFLAAREFGLAATHFPIVFVGNAETGDVVAAALLGLRDAENLYVDPQGQWDLDAYVPAFVRRYPFVLAEDGQSENLTVCVDSAFPGLNEKEGEFLFDDQGQETPYLKGMIDFMQQFRREMLLSNKLVRELADAGLLAARTIDVEMPDGLKRKLDGFMVVDEEKLASLDADLTAKLHASGALPLAYAHLVSINNLSRLVARLSQRLRVQAQGGAAPVPASVEAQVEA